MKATVHKRQLDEVDELIEIGGAILNASIHDDVTLNRLTSFRSRVIEKVRSLHEELPSKAQDLDHREFILYLTENEAEGARLLGECFVTNIWDWPNSQQQTELRCCIDVAAIRDALAWLQALKERLSSKRRQPLITSPDRARLAALIRQYRAAKMSDKEICQRLDENAEPLPEVAQSWTSRTWAEAYGGRKDRKETQRVKSFIQRCLKS
jgi:hypothetical protein